MGSGDDIDMDFDVDLGGGGADFNSSFSEPNPISDLTSNTGAEETQSASTSGTESELPNMADLGVDFTDNTGI